jgi:hypothetical protein
LCFQTSEKANIFIVYINIDKAAQRAIFKEAITDSGILRIKISDYGTKVCTCC